MLFAILILVSNVGGGGGNRRTAFASSSAYEFHPVEHDWTASARELIQRAYYQWG